MWTPSCPSIVPSVQVSTKPGQLQIYGGKRLPAARSDPKRSWRHSTAGRRARSAPLLVGSEAFTCPIGRRSGGLAQGAATQYTSARDERPLPPPDELPGHAVPVHCGAVAAR